MINITTLSTTQSILESLHISTINAGASYGAQGWSTSQDHQLISYNPTTEQAIATVNLCSEQDYQHIADKAQQAFLQWRNVPAPQRGEIVRQIGVALRAKKAELGALVSLEMGKSRQEGEGEVQEMIDMADLAVGQSRMLYGKMMQSERVAHRMYEQWHPVGIVGVISAFNFPVAVWAWNAFIAAITGNTVIWKPSAKTPLCAIAVQHICNQVMAQNNLEAIFSLFIPVDHKIATQFVNDPRIPLISFTGSTTVGMRINEFVTSRLGRCLMEMSGNNAIIVDETADLSLAIPAIVFGAIGTAGQRCTTTRRLMVHQSCYESVINRLKAAYQQVSIGDPLEPSNLMGPLIDQDAVNNFLAAIEQVKAAGGEILHGGHALDLTGFFVEPTLVRAENHWKIVQEETFAPILYVMPYHSIEEAIALNNQVRQGLSSSLFTNSLQHAEQFLSASGSDCGIANVNLGTSGAEIGGAFGGEKETGGGREAGSDVWKTYMRRQTNTINWGKELPLAQGIKFSLNLD